MSCEESGLTFDSQKQRKVMSRFATGVTVASTVADGQTWGMTANAVASLSLDPPLVLLAVVRGTPSHAMFTRGRCFALNILGESQKNIAAAFLKHARIEGTTINGFEFKTGKTCAPILTDAPFYLECEVDEWHEGTDHDVIVAKVTDAGIHTEQRPLQLRDTGWSYGG